MADSFPQASQTSSPASYDYQIYTDGSCYWKDGIGGYASVFCDNSSGSIIYRGGVETGSSVRRAEMKGLLAGLQIVGQFSAILDEGVRKSMLRGETRRPSVLWYTDREDICHAVTPEEGKRINSRDKDADLWASVAWYESWVSLTAVKVPRNTVGPQTEADRVCGELRKLLTAHVGDMKKNQNTLLQ